MQTKPRKITTIIVQKASDILVERIRDMIFQGEFGEGDLLPNERALMADSGLSRSSVREALRSLASEGLISTRSGRSGGSMVTFPGRDSIRRPVEQYIRIHDLSVESLLDCRLAIEPMLARLAATHRSDEEAEQLQQLQDEFAANVDNVPRYRTLNLEWHLGIARASRNQPLIALMEAIAPPILASSRPNQVTTDEIRRKTIKVHGRIQAAIMARDAAAAFTLMGQHVGAFHHLVHTPEAAETGLPEQKTG